MLMYDAVPDGVNEIPAHAQAVAGYVDGHYVSFPLLVHRFYPHAHCISIGIWGGQHADFTDVEEGNPVVTPAQVRDDFARRKSMGIWKPGYYAQRDTMENVILPGLAGIPRDEYRLWLAHWDGVAECPPGYEAKQFTNNKRPNGSDGPYDTSILGPGFFKPHSNPPAPKHPAVKRVVKRVVKPITKVHPKVAASTSAAAIAAAVIGVLAQNGVHMDANVTRLIEAVVVALSGYVAPTRTA